MDRNLFLLSLLAILSGLEVSNVDRFFTEFQPRYLKNRTPPTFYPYSSSECTCCKNRYDAFLQCEGKFLVTATDIFSSEVPPSYKYIRMSCNKTLTHADLNHDYPELIGLNRSEEHGVIMIDCPEPRFSFVRQLFYPEKTAFFGTEKKMLNNNTEWQNKITSLNITCVQRQNFSITKNHLESLTKLKVFEVSCLALEFLPSNLFQGTTPNIERISIYNSRIQHVPGRLFCDLAKLREVNLENNFIITISSQAFLGCGGLLKLSLGNNRLSYLDENLIDSIENITYLDLSRNILKELPKSFKKLTKLLSLDLSQNQLKQMKAEHCEVFSKVHYMNLRYNKLTNIHRNCFSNNLVRFDISGNALDDVTEQYPIELNKLNAFYMRDNFIPNLGIKRYLDSTKLRDFYMSNSNVISLHDETLHGFPSLIEVDFGLNNLESIPGNLFIKNGELRSVHLLRNNILSLPSGLFSENKKLNIIDLSWNNITVLPTHLFSENSRLQKLNLSHNRIESVPEGFLANVTSLSFLILSYNNLESLKDDFLVKMRRLYLLDLSYNRLNEIERKTFLPNNLSLNIRKLHLQGNNISVLSVLPLEKLEYLDLSMNELQNISKEFFCNLPNLKELSLSRNRIKTCYWNSKVQLKLERLDLSYNNLVSFHNESVYRILNLHTINLSNNNFKEFYVEMLAFASNLVKLNLSCNNIKFFRSLKFSEKDSIMRPSLKVLDLSSNGLHLDYSSTHFDERSSAWGRISPFHSFPNLEELHLSNNSITSVFLDWRTKMPYLKYLDLRHNKLHYLSYQDMIFSSTSFYEELGIGPYHCLHKLQVDLRHNGIRFVEFPDQMLAILPKKNETKGAYGHVTMLIDDNPFECGCAVFNLLRVIRYDVVLTSQLKRVKGHDLMLPAKLEIGNLSCSYPTTVRGKKVNNTEEWLHHLVPLFGLCALQDIF